MREIKFRGKRQKNGEWIYGSYISRGHHNYLYDLIIDYKSRKKAVIPETVGQFTGSKDKNGKEIYEGQKVRGFYDKTLVGENEFHEDGVVVWNNELGSFSIDNGIIKPEFSCFESFIILDN